MSHEIRAIHNSERISSLTRAMSDNNVDVIYKILDAKKHYSGVSGDGLSSSFKEIQILEALMLLEYHQHLKEIDFLKTTLSYMRKNKLEEIEIEFC